MKIEDSVRKYLTEFPYLEITIKNLLSHTSGLPAYDAYLDSVRQIHPDTIFTNSDLIPAMVLNKLPLLCKPGEKWNYDNINFIVLAILIEKVSGIKYQEYISRKILKPSGMNSTFAPFQNPGAFIPYSDDWASPTFYSHTYSDDLTITNTVPFLTKYWHTYNFRGFGEYISTIHDLLAYDRALHNDRLIPASLLRLAFTPVKLNDGNHNPSNYGLGWFILENNPFGTIVNHEGAAIGLTSIIVRNLTKDQTVIVLDNNAHNVFEISNQVIAILNKAPVQAPKRSAAKAYVREMLNHGQNAAEKLLKGYKLDTAAFSFNENEFNSIGYDLLGYASYGMPVIHHYSEAVVIFKLNTLLYPNSSNAYESYGEALELVNDKQGAITNFQRSLSLDRNNADAADHLKKLQIDGK